MKNIDNYITEKATDKEIKLLEEAFKKAWKALWCYGYEDNELKNLRNKLIKEYLKERDFYNLWDKGDGPWNEILGLVMDNLKYENFDDMYSIYNRSEIYKAMLQAYKNLYQK